jgi:hypothetical protein
MPDLMFSLVPDFLLFRSISNSQQDWQYAANEFVKQLPDDVIVHCKFSSCTIGYRV